MNTALLKSIATGLITLTISYTAHAKEKPNIVFIMADDLGVGWVDYDDSNKELNTPNTVSYTHLTLPTIYSV